MFGLCNKFRLPSKHPPPSLGIGRALLMKAFVAPKTRCIATDTRLTAPAESAFVY